MQIPGSEGRRDWGLDSGLERRAKGACPLMPEENGWTAGFLGDGGRGKGKQELRLNFSSGFS